MQCRTLELMRIALVGMIVTTALCCCGTHHNLAPSTRPRPESTSEPLTTSSLPAFQLEVKQAITEIAALRGWSPRLSVSVRVASPEVITHSMLADARAQMTPGAQV